VPDSATPQSANPPRPRVVLICHEQDPIDSQGLASWLANEFELVGIVSLREKPGLLWQRVRRELRRVGRARILDVVAFRIVYRIVHASADERWIEGEVQRLRARYPADLSTIPKIVAASPNGGEVESFVRGLAPDVMIARCKVILKRAIFTIPTAGTFVLHPGICPEYRNAHGCFWALARRDLDRVGMTMLRIDEGVDTGPMYFQGSYRFDERRESHAVIQYRVVLENLPVIGAALLGAWRGQPPSISSAGRTSATWGQPWLSAYLRWKWAALRSAR